MVAGLYRRYTKPITKAWRFSLKTVNFMTSFTSLQQQADKYDVVCLNICNDNHAIKYSTVKSRFIIFVTWLMTYIFIYFVLWWIIFNHTELVVCEYLQKITHQISADCHRYKSKIFVSESDEPKYNFSTRKHDL